MSFFSEASLAMIPSGYKTSKVYSALPITGDGATVEAESCFNNSFFAINA